MTKYQLIAAMTGNTTEAATITLPDGRKGILQAIGREDGSGSSFNLVVWISGKAENVYVRTTD